MYHPTKILMKKRKTYGPGDAMCDLVENDYRVLLIIGRLGIGLGMGDKNINEVCMEAGVDTGTFLAVINTILDENGLADPDFGDVSLSALLDGLVRAHNYYLDYRFPEIRQKLILAWGGSENDQLKVMIRYYDEFVEKVRQHVVFEEKIFFPYVRSLVDGNTLDSYCGELPESRHVSVMARLSELRLLLIKYFPALDTNRMNDVLLELHTCEYALDMHRKIEEVLLPRVISQLEGLPVKNIMEAP